MSVLVEVFLEEERRAGEKEEDDEKLGSLQGRKRACAAAATAAGMGGKSFFCPIFSFLRKSRRYDDDMSDWDGRTGYVRKVRSSDEDYGGWWVGERDVDQKASDFIATFHQRRLVV